MGKQKVKPNPRRLLRLPDLDHCKTAVLNSLGSPASRRVYEYAIDQFIAWLSFAKTPSSLRLFAISNIRKVRDWHGFDL